MKIINFGYNSFESGKRKLMIPIIDWVMAGKLNRLSSIYSIVLNHFLKDIFLLLKTFISCFTF